MSKSVPSIGMAMIVMGLALGFGVVDSQAQESAFVVTSTQKTTVAVDDVRSAAIDMILTAGKLLKSINPNYMITVSEPNDVTVSACSRKDCACSCPSTCNRGCSCDQLGDACSAGFCCHDPFGSDPWD